MQPTSSFRLGYIYSIVIVFFIAVSFNTTHAQDRTIGTLPIINNGEIIGDTEVNLNHTDDYKHILKIYNKLVAARGDFRYKVPELYLKDVKGRVASIDYLTNQITIEKHAYDVCKKHGDAAVAFLIGHELTHYYEKHAWQNGFVSDKSEESVYKELKKYQDVAHETEADYLGGFLAYTAGYGMYDKGGEIIGDLYTAYGLGETMKGYPTKTERIKLGNKSAQKLELLVDAFDMANLLFSINMTEEAYAYYEYILKDYQSRELYNNLGTVAVLNVMKLFKVTDLKYRYVSELDVDFQSSKDVSVPIEEQKTMWLDKAIAHFNSAISLDPNYTPAYLNRANAYALKREWKKAKFYLNEEALPVSIKDSIRWEEKLKSDDPQEIEEANHAKARWKKTRQDITILQGIIDANTGDEIAAKSKFTSVAEDGNALAAINLKICNGEPLPLPNFNKKDYTKDMIGDTSVHKFLRRSPPYDLDKVAGISNNFTLFQYKPTDGKSEIFYHENFESKERIAFQRTSKDYDGANLSGIKIGDLRSIVESETKDGTPTRVIETTSGQILIYDSTDADDKRLKGIIYFIEDNKVRSWIIYKYKTFIF
jgi:tetratricopeptide (TPR) repeat protein